jgi:hypothetical protein
VRYQHRVPTNGERCMHVRPNGARCKKGLAANGLLCTQHARLVVSSQTNRATWGTVRIQVRTSRYWKTLKGYAFPWGQCQILQKVGDPAWKNHTGTQDEATENAQRAMDELKAKHPGRVYRLSGASDQPTKPEGGK